LAQLLNVLVIEIPPLAARREDIPVLAQWHVERLNAAGGKQLAGLDEKALDALVEYDWPQNLEELAESIESACRQAAGPRITWGDLPPRVRMARDAYRMRQPPLQKIDLETYLRDVERQLIEEALASAKGNRSRAANLLSISRGRLLRRMHQLSVATDRTAADAETENES
jgi:DNA-binding NtrC family response regulator